MSLIKPRKPYIHTPKIHPIELDWLALEANLTEMGLYLPFGMLDTRYFTVSLEEWGKILYDLTFSGDLYKAEKRDCDWYALKAKTECEYRFEINTLAFVTGSTPQGWHAFNMICHPEGFLLFEPNDGYGFDGAFKIGENEYEPKYVLV